MAKLLWGKVYYQSKFAGILKQEPGGGSSFTYDSSYLEQENQAIAHNISLKPTPFIYQAELPPFFDNLVAEGWLEQAQSRLLGKRIVSRFELLLAFGYDCAGAVSIIDPNAEKISPTLIDINDPKEMALLTSRASLSGIQPKLAVIEKEGVYYPAHMEQLSTHIAKFPSNSHINLIINEYLTTIAFKHLLPEEDVVEMCIGKIYGLEEDALIIKRFDRNQGERINFEEFNQLLNHQSNAKYLGSYKNIADFIQHNSGCLKIEVYRLYLRILAGILLGNTDMHLKNFAMLHTSSGLRLTPVYDQVAAILYGYKQLALELNNNASLIISKLTATDIINLGIDFGLKPQTILMAFNMLNKTYNHAKLAVLRAKVTNTVLKQQIAELIESIWKQTFASIGKILSPKQ